MISNITSTSVNVSWEFPGGDVNAYLIQYKPSSVEWTSNDRRSSVVVGELPTSALINDLLPNTMYNLRILTNNANGDSRWSLEANFTTQRKS